MSQYAMLVDLNRCTGCLYCTVACKAANPVGVGEFWNKTFRIGPTPKEGGSGHFPDVEMYFLPVQCQHCANPECVNVCPTGASVKLENGIVNVDTDACIGCGLCVSACPYNIRYVELDSGVAKKCNFCIDRVEEGLLPACVMECGARARFFGDLEKGIENLECPAIVDITEGEPSYEKGLTERWSVATELPAFTEENIYKLNDFGNGPQELFVLRNFKWQDKFTDFDAVLASEQIW